MRFRSYDGHYYMIAVYVEYGKMVECGREELDDIVGRFTVSKSKFWKMIRDESWTREEES